MSITKNTRRGKKVAPAADSPAPPAKTGPPRFRAEYVEKYANLGIVHEGEIGQFVSTTRLDRLDAYGGRFTVLMDALEAARRQPSTKARRAVAKLIAALEQESRDRRYRQLLQAIAEAARSEEGIHRACWTALRTVEMLFEWSAEYMYAFRLYTQRVKQARRPTPKAAAKRTTK